RCGCRGVQPLPVAALFGNRAARRNHAGRIGVRVWLRDNLVAEEGEPAPGLVGVLRAAAHQIAQHATRPARPRYRANREAGIWEYTSIVGQHIGGRRPDPDLLVENSLPEVARPAI